MIQRIQTVYLLLVTGLLIAAMCLPMATIIDLAGATQAFKPLGLILGDVYQSTWGLFCILLLAAIIDFATIFLYKNRMLQLRMCIFSTCLLIGFYLAFAAFYFVLKGDISLFQISWALSLPLVAIILNYLAIRGIGADEAKVQSLNRLR